MQHYMKFGVMVIAVVIISITGLVYGHDNLQLLMIKIAHGNGKSICSTAQTALSPDGKMSFDEKTGTLVVVDRPDYLPHINELVGTLDVKIPMVEISVRIAEVEEEFIRKAGIHSAQVIFPRGSYDIVLDLLNTRTGAFTKSDMILKTTSGVPAQLQVDRESLFGSARIAVPGGKVSNMQKQGVGDLLEVLPVANYDNTVTIKLRPAMSSVQDDGTISDSVVLTQVTLHSGDTFAIGGVDTQANASGRKTMIFLTAKIIY